MDENLKQHLEKAQLSLQLLISVQTRLKEALAIPLDASRISVDATIQRFEFTIELFWKTLKRMLSLEGQLTSSPREALQRAYAMQWLKDENIWLRMLEDRNMTSHTYNEKKADEIYAHIKEYAPRLDEVITFLSQHINTYTAS